MRDTDVDTELLALAASEALSRPSDSSWFPEAFTTHGLVHSWADRMDDIRAESNHHAMLKALQHVESMDDTAQARKSATGEPDVLEIGAAHFAPGHVTLIFVRVYANADRTEYTAAFVEAVRLAESLREYPVLDDSDYSEREHREWEKAVEWALDMAWRDDDRAELVEFDDRDALERAFWARLRADSDAYEAVGGPSSDEVDGDGVALIWREVRSQFYAPSPLNP